MQSGYLLISKPKGISSFKALAIAQKKLSIEMGIKKIKMGHAGTLDPLAEGLLLCAVGEGTKMLSSLLLQNKEYHATLHLGFESTTDDNEGEKNKISEKIPIKDEIQNVLTSFIGEITQTPPIYSALKIDGKRACDRVRNGETVEMKTRKVYIEKIELLEYQYPFLSIRVKCGTGTYIRSLARDIGNQLQTGAYLSFLQRTQVGEFYEKNAKNPEEICVSDIFSFEKKHFNFPFVEISKEEYEDLCGGKWILKTIEKNYENQEIVVGKNETSIVGLARIVDGLIRPKSIMQNIIF